MYTHESIARLEAVVRTTLRSPDMAWLMHSPYSLTLSPYSCFAPAPARGTHHGVHLFF